MLTQSKNAAPTLASSLFPQQQLHPRGSCHRRGFIAPGLLLAAGFALLPPALAKPGPQPSAANKAVPERGLRLAWDDMPRSFDPRYVADANSWYLADLSSCALLRFTPDARVQPSVAESWTWQSPTELKMQLRSGLSFSDGEAITAPSIAAYYEDLRQPRKDQPRPITAAFVGVKSVKASGSHQLVFRLNKPDAAFLENLSVGLLAKAARSQVRIDDKVAAKMPGCGPFRIAKRSVNSIELVRNPKYQLGPVPQLPSLSIKVVKDEGTRLAKLRRGELDLVQNGLDRAKLHNLEKTAPQLRLQKAPALKVSYLAFNFRDKQLQQRPLRRAMALAIKREPMLRMLLADMAEPAAAILPRSHPFARKDLAVSSYDPAAAEALLDKAGLKRPKPGAMRIELKLSIRQNDTRQQIAQAIASDLRKVGIGVQVQSYEWGRFQSELAAGRAQMWLGDWVGFKDPDIYHFVFSSHKQPPNGANRGHYHNPALDELLEKGRSITDRSQRLKIYGQVEEIVAAELPYVFLYHELHHAVMARQLRGYEIYADGRYSALASSRWVQSGA